MVPNKTSALPVKTAMVQEKTTVVPDNTIVAPEKCTGVCTTEKYSGNRNSTLVSGSSIILLGKKIIIPDRNILVMLF